MEFSRNQPIYLQIADHICEKILLEIWKEGERIPSVRDFAVELEVNPNTVMRTFTLLEEKKIVLNQRGIGFFVTENGIQKAKDYMTSLFLKGDLPYLFKKMNLLKMRFSEIKTLYDRYNEENKKRG
jgi:DNA-binding transcriptional regulator YhcF (GntR family)